MPQEPLFSPFTLGPLALPNRIVMAPLTRNRAGPGMVPAPLAADYYRQRAAAGLVIAEATQISPEGQGYQDTPGIYSAAQVAGWRKVTDAVHGAGGRMMLQLWHVGRISNVALQPGGAPPVAPSAILAHAKTFVGGQFVETSMPRALALDELPGLVDSYVAAARNAIAAGFDGVEIHAANGYLLDQFLRDGANHRSDAYGGPIAHRIRLVVEVAAAVAAAIGADRTGIRLSPVSPVNDLADSAPGPLFKALVGQLDGLDLAFVHVIEGVTRGPREAAQAFDFAGLRRAFRGAYIANNGYDRPLADAALRDGRADLIAFGRLFIANPDLVERLRRDGPYNPLNDQTLYGGGATGYTDYPALAAE